jgi:hypothetical protein
MMHVLDGGALLFRKRVQQIGQRFWVRCSGDHPDGAGALRLAQCRLVSDPWSDSGCVPGMLQAHGRKC